MTVKGQVTIPVKLRRQLDLHPGDVVEFSQWENKIFIAKSKTDISATFGLLKANKKISVEDMEKAIQKGKARSK
jgi:AbrB family looped-hinge helix DNA binding protein